MEGVGLPAKDFPTFSWRGSEVVTMWVRYQSLVPRIPFSINYRGPGIS